MLRPPDLTVDNTRSSARNSKKYRMKLRPGENLHSGQSWTVNIDAPNDRIRESEKKLGHYRLSFYFLDLGYCV